MSFFSNKNDLSLNEVKALKRQMSSHTKVHTKIPQGFEGADGDMRVVIEGNSRYLYLKVLGQWVKSKLTKGEVQATSEASDSEEATTSTGTSSTVTVSVNGQFSDADSTHFHGWDSYLKATKESADSNETAAANNRYAKPDLANGSYMYTSASAVTKWIPYNLSSPNLEYFSTDATPGYLFTVDYTGLISGVRERTPSTLTVSGEALGATSIRLTVNGNTEVIETVRIYYKLASSGSYGGSDYKDITIATNNQISDHTFTHDFTDANDGLDPIASTAYDFKVEGRNSASTHNVGAQSSEIEVTTPSASSSWGTINDFTMTAFGLPGEGTGDWFTEYKTISINNGTAASNSTTVSLVLDSGSAFEYGVALSTSGDPGISGTANSGTGYSTSRSVNLGHGTLYIRFRHRFKESFVGSNANVSVTFANTSGSLANYTDLDITMVNSTSGGG